MNDLREFIAVSRGHKKASYLLKNGQLVNVLSAEIYPANVAIYKDKIVGIGDYEAEKVIDLNGKYICPGFMDSHVHIESSLLTPAEFSRVAVPQGVTAVVADPHEIGNVLGATGIKYMLYVSEGLPLDIYIMLPSCIPSTKLETSGAELKAKGLKPLLKKKRVLGLAEVMNYPGVLERDPDLLAKLNISWAKLIDGHAPGLSGKDLSAYIGAGIYSEHEAVTAEEAKEKLRLGMHIKIREGSSAKNLEVLLPLVTSENSQNFSFCTDDRFPEDLAKGYMNKLLKKAVKLGLPPIIAIQMVTINPARYHGLNRVGAVASGYFADIVVVDDLHDFNVEMVFKRGKLVAEKGKPLFTSKLKRKKIVKETMNVKPINIENLKIKAKSNYVKVIETLPDQIITTAKSEMVLVEDGYAVSDVGKDILKLAVIERHKASGRIGLGFVKGFGLKKGALASSVAHDSHNIICVGAGDEDILSAIRQVIKMKGGMAIVAGGLVLAELPLPIAGLMSEAPLSEVIEKMVKLDEAAKEIGCVLPHPFGILSFLALPVIPELKLTDRGLVDVKKFKIVDLFE